jgi:hypothetical protein
MDVFDLYPVNDNENENENEKKEFIILEEIIKELLKKKRKRKEKSIKEDNNENLNSSQIIKDKPKHVEEVIGNLIEMKGIKDVEVLKDLVLKYLPICKNMIDEFNDSMKQLQKFLNFDVSDILIHTAFIDSSVTKITFKNSTLQELYEIINKILIILRILIENYLILDKKFLH